MRGDIPPHIFMAWYFVKHRDNFNFTYTFTVNTTGRTEYQGSCNAVHSVYIKQHRDKCSINFACLAAGDSVHLCSLSA
jgi:hypothetical protein